MTDSPYLYLSVSQIRELHDAVVEVFGGAGGAENREKLDSCVDAPKNVAFLKEGDVFEQASAYACSIVSKSSFKEGNRGTALAAALVFLDINGVMEIDYDEAMLVQAMLSISATVFPNDDPLLDFNMRQNGHFYGTATWARIASDYARTPVKPVIDGEPIYEDHPIGFEAARRDFPAPASGEASSTTQRGYLRFL